MLTQNLFFEIVSEEIPAKMQKAAGVKAIETMTRLLKDRKIHHGQMKASCAPRRLWICVRDVESVLMAQTVEKRGPKTTAPNTAVQGFLKTNNAKSQDLITKNGYFFLNITQPETAFEDQIPSLFSDFIHTMPWPKSMRWNHPKTGEPTFPWVRPVRHVIGFWGQTPLSFDIPEWGLQVTSVTIGNRFLNSTFIPVNSVESYWETLQKHFVICDYNERQNAVRKAIDNLLQSHPELILKEDATLMDEVTGLVDFPFAMMGKISPEFMKLPDFVLSTAMRVHQKYFTVLNQDHSIAPYFIAITNTNPQEEVGQIVLNGFEKVLKARLSDALFFYQEDLKKPLSSRTPLLNSIIFHKSLGSLGQKVQRLIQIMPNCPGGKRAAALCKLDLTTQMVGEFDELQGICGAHYAEVQGESKDVAQAIQEHYKPLGANDSVPETLTGKELALSDKMDSLIGFLGIGLLPSGSKDPFALRRLALGIIRLSINCPELNIMDRAKSVIRAYEDQGITLKDDVLKQTINFFFERLAVFLKDQYQIRFDIVSCVLSWQQAAQNPLDIYEIKKKAEALNLFFIHEDSSAFLLLFNRVYGLLERQDLKNLSVDSSLFEKNEENEAYQALKTSTPVILSLIQEKKYEQAAHEISILWPVFKQFFEAVQIHTEDEKRKRNRQALLNQCFSLYQSIADFSKIQIH